MCTSNPIQTCLRMDSNSRQTGWGKGEPSKFGSLLAPTVIGSRVALPRTWPSVAGLESQLVQLREIVLGTPSQSPPPQQQQQQAVPTPGARAAEPDAKIAKTSENNSNNDDNDDARPSRRRRQHHCLFAAIAAINHTENQPGWHCLARILVIIVIAVCVPGHTAHETRGQLGGVFQDRLVSDGVALGSTLAWIGSLQAGIKAMIALPSVWLITAYGLVPSLFQRCVALLGTALVTAGLVLVSFCPTSVAGLIVTQGIMYSLGLGLLYFAVATLLSVYFLCRWNLATSNVYTGAGIGGAVYVLAAHLLETVSVAWTLRGSASVAGGAGARGKRIVNWSAFKDRRFALLVVCSSIMLFLLFVPLFFLLYAGSVGLSLAVSSVIFAGPYTIVCHRSSPLRPPPRNT
ncbi:hypothetical protein DFJ73DRAFT_937490 [Zopfochytrium polystomum]|nr:hypothetical protein DFJ73DRAFT_937490 [Zopfochytrium polystomum]